MLSSARDVPPAHSKNQPAERPPLNLSSRLLTPKQAPLPRALVDQCPAPIEPHGHELA